MAIKLIAYTAISCILFESNCYYLAILFKFHIRSKLLMTCCFSLKECADELCEFLLIFIVYN